MSASATMFAALVIAATSTTTQGWRGRLRVGAGADSNVFHDFDATRQAALLRLDGYVETDPIRKLRLKLEANFEQNTSITALNEGEVLLNAGYFHKLSDALRLSLGSRSVYRRDLAVFSLGRLVEGNHAALRSELGQHLIGALTYQLGRLDIEGSVRGDAKRTFDAEVYSMLGIETAFVLRWIPTSWVAVGARYGYTFRDFSGLVAPNPSGEIVAQSRDLALSIHGARASVRLYPMEGLWLSLGYDLELFADNFLGYFDGEQHRGRAAVVIDSGNRIIFEVSAELVHRSFPMPTAPAVNRFSNTIATGFVDLEYWLTSAFGAYARYAVEHDAADSEGTLFIRHVVTVGPAGRLPWSL